eukprot:CAMPEP_0183338942 /NCGR_PEP_ID=MMETSP0164_2-20130417/6054_1 /TAXON_ID=221442 /ORGANISM="Coccolithus pelagicus ssp braarudi, Strain PLY182g" /LENGTH=323 /DNA_ID=CAMNT_0025508869 /DNA_START=55 /DNA_END=1026 /DNA_ORIENTATION=-
MSAGTFALSLDDYLTAATAKANDPSRCGYALSRNLLMAIREAKVHRPDLVSKFGVYLLQHHSSRLANEVWALYEQVYIALLQYAKVGKGGSSRGADAKEMRLATQYCTTLSARFPGSLRVKRLKAMMLEAKGEYEVAMNEYDEIMKEDPNNLFAMKRQVACLRARNKPSEAAKKLVEHLNVVCADADAWVQLADLYLQQQQHRKAAFCMEELILINPMNYMYHIRYGEILFTIGGCERGHNAELVRTARKYFAHALELKPQNNLRALYGLLLCCAAAGKGSKKGDVTELLGFTKQSLLEVYASYDKKSPMLRTVEAMIESLLS